MNDPVCSAQGDNAQAVVDSCIQGKTRCFWHECAVQEAIQAVRDNMPAILKPQLLNDSLLFMNRGSKVVVLDESDFGNPENWFFIGDMHGDFYALHTMLQRIQKTCPEFRLVFLGDIVDRGIYSVECIVLLLVWVMDHPGQIAWIAGNHDIAFSKDPETWNFSSSVIPSEFVDALNADACQHPSNRSIGDIFIWLTQRLPRALLFPDGLLATHGGFPLTDLHGAASSFSTREEFFSWLNSNDCLQDFTWTRITRYRKRMPNRLSKGCSYGFLDFEAFCNLRPEWFPVKRMVTGHEHVQDGFHAYPEYLKNPALTLTGFGFDELKESGRGYADYRVCLVAGRYRADALPTMFEVSVGVDELRELYPDSSIRDAESVLTEGCTAP